MHHLLLNDSTLEKDDIGASRETILRRVLASDVDQRYLKTEDLRMDIEKTIKRQRE